ncbi:MAG: apolipoprotein N-acyltransferase [Promicromonosporaceae bacterium]|nr:apolipoprotein N-acyltransferase [Promicromonosporaceae bacterium]
MTTETYVPESSALERASNGFGPGQMVPPKLVALLQAALAGLLLWLAFPDTGHWPLGLVGVGLLWWAFTIRPRAGWNALIGFIAGLLFFGPLLWFTAVATALVPWIAVTLLQAAFFAVLGLLWTWTNNANWWRANPWTQALGFAVLFTGVEQWRSLIPFGGLPWGRLAWSVAGAPPGRVAWFGGSVLVTFVLTLAATLLFAPLRIALEHFLLDIRGTPTVTYYAPARLPTASVIPAVSPVVESVVPDNSVSPSSMSQLTSKRVRDEATKPWAYRPWPRVAIGLGAALILLLAPLLLPLPRVAGVTTVAPPRVAEVSASEGVDRSRSVDAGVSVAEAGVLHVGIAQGNVVGRGQEADVNANAVFQDHLAATRQLAADIAARRATGGSTATPPELDLVIWPENAAAWDPTVQPVVANALDAATADVGAPILVGTMEYPDYGGRYNVSLLWESGVGVTSRYAKRLPVPFGEYIPLRSFARLFTDQVDRLTVDMIAADNPPVIVMHSDRLGREIMLGIGICFEVAYDPIFYDAARLGAEFLVIPTNNASFGDTAQSTQQLQMTRLQAITTGRAAIQISTMGVSGVVTPDGQLVAATDLWTQDRISALIPLRTTLTPAVHLGMVPAYLFAGFALVLPVIGLVVGRLTKDNRMPVIVAGSEASVPEYPSSPVV